MESLFLMPSSMEQFTMGPLFLMPSSMEQSPLLRGGESVEVLDELEEAYRSTAVLRGVESIKSSPAWRRTVESSPAWRRSVKFCTVQVVSRLEAHGSSRLPLGGAQSSRLSRRSSHYCKPWLSERETFC